MDVEQTPLSEFKPNDAGLSADDSRVCRTIDWYSEGESRTVYVDGVRITIRFVGRRGRRGRIAITAPSGTVFLEPSPENSIPE
jgi:hypothetical protein